MTDRQTDLKNLTVGFAILRMQVIIKILYEPKRFFALWQILKFTIKPTMKTRRIYWRNIPEGLPLAQADVPFSTNNTANVCMTYERSTFWYLACCSFLLCLYYKIQCRNTITVTHNSIVFFGIAARRGLWPPRPRCFLITHSDASQSVGLHWPSDQIVEEISTWQNTTHTTDKHPCPRWDFFYNASFVRILYFVVLVLDLGPHAVDFSSRILTHDRSRRAAIDLRLRPRGHRDRHNCLVLPLI
jgi:hypothetical protein